MLDKIGVAFILVILFLGYAVANPAGAAEVLIAGLVGAALGLSLIAFLKWRSLRLGK
jgi:regulator of protease activity HflC (stomatin/prohibitin superfamily)